MPAVNTTDLTALGASLTSFSGADVSAFSPAYHMQSTVLKQPEEILLSHAEHS